MNVENMLKEFPKMIPSKDLTSWKGLIMCDTYIEICCPNIPKLDNLEVHIPQLSNFHHFNYKKALIKAKESTFTLSEFLKEFILIMEKYQNQNLLILHHISNLSINDKFYTVIEEINLYDQYVHSIDEHLKHVIFKVVDNLRRDHFITIYIPDKYPIENQLLFETMVPSIIMNSYSKTTTISKLFEYFKTIIYDLNSFWNIHQEILETCNVIGTYTFKDFIFKIPIDGCVVEITVNPLYPNYCPKFGFHGQPDSIDKFQQQLNHINPNLIWKTDNTFKDNILNIFKIDDLLLECNQENIDQNLNNSEYCFICYDQLTIKTKACINEKCDAVYHIACICEWLLNSGSTPMFDHLQGKCPQCDNDILVALENFN